MATIKILGRSYMARLMSLFMGMFMPMFISLLIGGCLIGATVTEATAQDETFAAKLGSETIFGIGLQAGLTTGTGVSFRYQTPGRFAFELTAGYITLSDPMGSVGGEVNFNLSTSDNTRVYALGGASVNYVGKDGSNSLEAPWRAGLGVGFEWFFARNISLAGELPITVFFQDPIGVLPLPQLQFMFFFQ